MSINVALNNLPGVNGSFKSSSSACKKINTVKKQYSFYLDFSVQKFYIKTDARVAHNRGISGFF